MRFYNEFTWLDLNVTRAETKQERGGWTLQEIGIKPKGFNGRSDRFSIDEPSATRPQMQIIVPGFYLFLVQ